MRKFAPLLIAPLLIAPPALAEKSIAVSPEAARRGVDLALEAPAPEIPAEVILILQNTDPAKRKDLGKKIIATLATERKGALLSVLSSTARIFPELAPDFAIAAAEADDKLLLGISKIIAATLQGKSAPTTAALAEAFPTRLRDILEGSALGATDHQKVVWTELMETFPGLKEIVGPRLGALDAQVPGGRIVVQIRFARVTIAEVNAAANAYLNALENAKNIVQASTGDAQQKARAIQQLNRLPINFEEAVQNVLNRNLNINNSSSSNLLRVIDETESADNPILSNALSGLTQNIDTDQGLSNARNAADGPRQVLLPGDVVAFVPGARRAYSVPFDDDDDGGDDDD